ncbi:hypothetical protein HDU76_008652 [Blyttiomyces sp. JEL0837]|nr:hypothetical protein HDU76_008652 [Blyttiomyces sp. JEL0837]
MITSQLLQLVVVVLAGVNSARAQFSNIVAFGDSFSDNGSGTYALTFGLIPPSPPYFQGRFSNNIVWVEHLSNIYQCPLTCFAYGGSMATNSDVPPNLQLTVGRLPDLSQQLSLFQKAGVKYNPSTTLYTVFSGANDYIDKFDQGGVNAGAVSGAVLDFLKNLVGVAGAVNIVVLNMPPIDKTPEWHAKPAAVGVAEAFNQELNAGIQALMASNPGINIMTGDIYGYLNSMIDSNSGLASSNGITNVDTSCLVGNTNNVCPDPDSHLFWDGVHLTTKGHAVLAQSIASTVVAMQAPAVGSGPTQSQSSGSVTTGSSVDSSGGGSNGGKNGAKRGSGALWVEGAMMLVGAGFFAMMALV